MAVKILSSELSNHVNQCAWSCKVARQHLCMLQQDVSATHRTSMLFFLQMSVNALPWKDVQVASEALLMLCVESLWNYPHCRFVEDVGGIGLGFLKEGISWTLVPPPLSQDWRVCVVTSLPQKDWPQHLLPVAKKISNHEEWITMSWYTQWFKIG